MKFTTILKKSPFIAIPLFLCATIDAGTVTIDFLDEDQFDGTDIMGSWDISGAEYGGVSGLTITTLAFSDHPGHTGATWNITAGGAGGPNSIKTDEFADGDGGSVFDPEEEEWTFAVNQDITSWDGFLLSGFTGTDQFFISSTDWIGLSVTPGSPDVTFSSVSGTLLMSAVNGDLEFTFEELTGGTLLPVSAGTAITMGAPSSSLGGVRLDAFSFNVGGGPEPEPTYEGFAHLTNGWIYFHDTAAWAWLADDPLLYNTTTEEWAVASASGIGGTVYLFYPWVYSETLQTYLWYGEDLTLWDLTAGEYVILTVPDA
jgi:hypothetical protein